MLFAAGHSWPAGQPALLAPGPGDQPVLDEKNSIDAAVRLGIVGHLYTRFQNE